MTDAAICIPVLASLDIAESQAFYQDQLGFAAERHGDYLLVHRNRMEIHFWLADDRRYPEHTSCYIRGGEILDLHAEFSARGVPGLSAIEDKPWGMTEFHIHDPHGNLLRFGGSTRELRG
ncbi:VOC family protein [Tistrella mobilis]|uniref:bleomycin resistance protein n=1 Tax=Tistrella mobilis TaxID=171437 RepID=UPI0031F6C8B5